MDTIIKILDGSQGPQYSVDCVVLFLFCAVVPDCGNPLSPRHGAVEYESVIPGSQAHYRCDDYYVLVGDKSLTCENGVWVGKQPTCQSKSRVSASPANINTVPYLRTIQRVLVAVSVPAWDAMPCIYYFVSYTIRMPATV